MELISIIILSIFIILLFYLLNCSFKKRKYNEYFNKLPEGTLCGTKNDVCSIDEYGTNSCCKGYICVRPEGNFEYKICRKPEQSYSDASSSHITHQNFNKNTFPKIFSNIHFPGISKPELPSNMNIFSSKFWDMNNICKFDSNNSKNSTNSTNSNNNNYTSQEEW
jgi:hypothetical protein